ncbi:MAG: hypothetical protein ACK2UO_13085 [Caldilineaceae bacterium]|jgi:hypothetical protein
MARKLEANTWQEDPANVITLVNKSGRNYILELPSGRVRLDAGRRIRTLKSILNVTGIRDLVNEGTLEVVFE